MNKTLLFGLLLMAGSIIIPGQINASGYKEKTSRIVYNELINAFGDGRKAPELRFLNYRSIKDSIVAAYVPGDVPFIEIEEIAYDVCSSFGKDSLNALACVLGHELAHYYLKHDWCSNFSKRLSHISIAADLNKIDKQEQLKKESEADYNGFYFGSIAGYKTFDIAPLLLRKLYSTYKLNTNLRGYPTLDQRVEAATQSKAMVLRRLPVFEAGTCLYEIGEYELAFDCFNNLVSDFTSRENYNNAAVCKLQMALPLFELPEMPFCFPFEIDYETRISSGSNRSGSLQTEQQRKTFLTEAKKLLEESIRRDPAYNKAKINLAICYVMLDNADMASGIIKEMESDSSAEKNILTAIVSAKRGDLVGALQTLSLINLDSSNTNLLSNNKYLFELAVNQKLRIGDDELGYQLRKSWNFNTIRILDNGIHREEVSCLDSSAKSVKVITDSLNVSTGTRLFFLKGNENYSHGLLLKPASGDYAIYLYFISYLNDCLIPKKNSIVFFRRDTISETKLQGYLRSSVLAIKE
jgi:tetratricopeptide (TPR) repeat protein